MVSGCLSLPNDELRMSDGFKIQMIDICSDGERAIHVIKFLVIKFKVGGNKVQSQ